MSRADWVADFSFRGHTARMTVHCSARRLRAMSPSECAVVITRLMGTRSVLDPDVADAWMASDQWMLSTRSVDALMTPCSDPAADAQPLDLEWMVRQRTPFFFVEKEDAPTVRVRFADGTTDMYYNADVSAHRMFSRPTNVQRRAIRAFALGKETDVSNMTRKRRDEWNSAIELLRVCRGDARENATEVTEYNIAE